MAKYFIYVVNGTEIESTEAFGKAYAKAKEIATANRTYIERYTVNGDDVERYIETVFGYFKLDRLVKNGDIKIY